MLTEWQINLKKTEILFLFEITIQFNLELQIKIKSIPNNNKVLQC